MDLTSSFWVEIIFFRKEFVPGVAYGYVGLPVTLSRKPNMRALNESLLRSDMCFEKNQEIIKVESEAEGRSGRSYDMQEIREENYRSVFLMVR
jgi:hypothetical protein